MQRVSDFPSWARLFSSFPQGRKSKKNKSGPMNRKAQQRELKKFTHFSVSDCVHTKVCKKQMFSNVFCPQQKICFLSKIKNKWFHLKIFLFISDEKQMEFEIRKVFRYWDTLVSRISVLWTREKNWDTQVSLWTRERNWDTQVSRNDIFWNLNWKIVFGIRNFPYPKGKSPEYLDFL
jgi:hypothetical protein